MIRVSSDPHAYLRPLYRTLLADRSFPLLSTATRFDQLVELVARESATQAARLRQLTPVTQAALLGHLASMESQRPGRQQVELWAARKRQRVLACVAVYLPSGIDLRLLEDGEFRRTQMVKNGPDAERLADEWQSAAAALGWTLPATE